MRREERRLGGKEETKGRIKEVKGELTIKKAKKSLYDCLKRRKEGV